MKTLVYHADDGTPEMIDAKRALPTRIIGGRRCTLSHEVCEPDNSGLWGGNGWVEPEPSGGASKEKGYMISQSLPLNYKYARMAGCAFDKRGRPVFTSMRQQKEMLAIAKSYGEPIIYDA